MQSCLSKQGIELGFGRVDAHAAVDRTLSDGLAYRQCTSKFRLGGSETVERANVVDGRASIGGEITQAEKNPMARYSCICRATRATNGCNGYKRQLAANEQEVRWLIGTRVPPGLKHGAEELRKGATRGRVGRADPSISLDRKDFAAPQD